MITVSVANGSQPEILNLVHAVRTELGENIRFIVFDSNENIDEGGIWDYVHCESETEAVQKAVSCVAMGEAQIILKGIIATRTLLKEILKPQYKLRIRRVISHVAWINIPDYPRPLILTDAAMNINPDFNGLIEIVENAVQAAQKTGLKKPKIALLSAVEKVNEKMPSTVLADCITNHYQNRVDCVVYGPISLDLATSMEAVRHKRYEGPIMGDADVLVVPNIETGNVLYKSLTIFSHATAGGMIVGTKVPVVITSRSDSTESKLLAMKFAIQQL